MYLHRNFTTIPTRYASRAADKNSGRQRPKQDSPWYPLLTSSQIHRGRWRGPTVGPITPRSGFLVSSKVTKIKLGGSLGGWVGCTGSLSCPPSEFRFFHHFGWWRPWGPRRWRSRCRHGHDMRRAGSPRDVAKERRDASVIITSPGDDLHLPCLHVVCPVRVNCTYWGATPPKRLRF